VYRLLAGVALLFISTMLYGTGDAGKINTTGISTAQFPRLTASNLENREFHLPEDFQGEHNLLLIAFQREQQTQLDTWLREMPRLQQIDAGLQYYELPTIARLNALARWFIDSGMRRGIPNKSARARTITLYIDKKPFEDSLQLPTEKTVYALLVDRAGKVLWRADGPYDEAKGESLRKALKPLANDNHRSPASD
jgi:hypothetical protein